MQITHAYDWRGRTLLDQSGDKIGRVEEIYRDQQTGQLERALVHTGLFGAKSSFVPLAGASPNGEDVRVSVDAAQVKDAPRIDGEGELSQQEAELFRHCDVPYDGSGTVTAEDAPSAGDGHDTSGPTTDEAMTRYDSSFVGDARLFHG